MNEEEFSVGDFLYCSWGYDQTNIDFCQIVEVSKTQKTVKCRMCTKAIAESQRTYDNVKPANQIGDPFKLWVRRYGNYLSFRGQYPFCAIHGNFSASRMGSFSRYDGQPKYETNPMFGH